MSMFFQRAAGGGVARSVRPGMENAIRSVIDKYLLWGV